MSSASSWPHLIVPGWGGSEPTHWQSVWQPELDADRVELDDWHAPEPARWIAAIDHAVVAMLRHDPRPPILVAHSLGCIAITHWARTIGRPVRAALLVAPPDVELSGCIPMLREFAPVPLAALPFSSAVIASDNDPYSELARSEQFARSWGSDFHVVPGAGHLNTASNLGRWAHGRAILSQLLSRTLLRGSVELRSSPS